MALRRSANSLRSVSEVPYAGVLAGNRVDEHVEPVTSRGLSTFAERTFDRREGIQEPVTGRRARHLISMAHTSAVADGRSASGTGSTAPATVQRSTVALTMPHRPGSRAR